MNSEYITYALAVIIIVQQVYILFSEKRHSTERTDLLNRLMAKDTGEYVSLKDGEVQPKSRSRNVIKGSHMEELRSNGYLNE